MSNYRHWMLLMSAGALASACQLDLDGRACGLSEQGEEGACLDGWSCCPGNVCQRECTDSTTPSPNGSTPAPSGEHQVGSRGAELVAGEARAQIPEGALEEDTSLALEVVPLPMELPRARDQASLVYALGTRDTQFNEFVTVELPTTASEISYLMLLELDEDWHPVQGARYLSPDRNHGSVAFSTGRGGTFVVVSVRQLAALDAIVGGTSYNYSCDVGASASFVPDENGGQGPVIDTASGVTEGAPCPWPLDAPRLSLTVLLRGFVGRTGPIPGTFDLTSPESVSSLRAKFGVSHGEPVSVEDQVPYQFYDSTTPVDSTAPSPYPALGGYQQSSLASGSVTVSRLTTVGNAGYSINGEEDDPFGKLYQVDFENVTLAASNEGLPDPADPFPPSVSIPSATLTFSY